MEKFSLNKFNSAKINTESLHNISGGAPTDAGCEFARFETTTNKCGEEITRAIFVRWDSDNTEGGRCGTIESYTSCTPC